MYIYIYIYVYIHIYINIYIYVYIYTYIDEYTNTHISRHLIMLGAHETLHVCGYGQETLKKIQIHKSLLQLERHQKAAIFGACATPYFCILSGTENVPTFSEKTENVLIVSFKNSWSVLINFNVNISNSPINVLPSFASFSPRERGSFVKETWKKKSAIFLKRFYGTYWRKCATLYDFLYIYMCIYGGNFFVASKHTAAGATAGGCAVSSTRTRLTSVLQKKKDATDCTIYTTHCIYVHTWKKQVCTKACCSWSDGSRLHCLRHVTRLTSTRLWMSSWQIWIWCLTDWYVNVSSSFVDAEVFFWDM